MQKSAQYYVTEFRGNPVQFADLANIKSVSEINGMYSLFLDSKVMFVLCDLILIFAVTVTTKVRKIKIRSRIISGVAVIAGCFVFVYGGRFAYDLGIKNRYIRLNFSGAENADTYRCVGYDLMFCFDGMFDRVTKPLAPGMEQVWQMMHDEDAQECLQTLTEEGIVSKVQ